MVTRRCYRMDFNLVSDLIHDALSTGNNLMSSALKLETVKLGSETMESPTCSNFCTSEINWFRNAISCKYEHSETMITRAEIWIILRFLFLLMFKLLQCGKFFVLFCIQFQFRVRALEFSMGLMMLLKLWIAFEGDAKWKMFRSTFSGFLLRNEPHRVFNVANIFRRKFIEVNFHKFSFRRSWKKKVQPFHAIKLNDVMKFCRLHFRSFNDRVNILPRATNPYDDTSTHSFWTEVKNLQKKETKNNFSLFSFSRFSPIKTLMTFSTPFFFFIPS